MASADMKAVITLTADASGVQAGVSKAMASLNKMSDMANSFRGSIAGQAMSQLFNMAKDALHEIDKRITDAAHAYSPQAMMSANDLAITQQQQDQRLGQAYGDVVAFIDRFKAQAIVDATQFLIDHKEEIGRAMESFAEFSVAVMNATEDFVLGVANAVNWIDDLINSPAKAATSAANSFIDAGLQNPMTYPVFAIYDLIRQKLGGS